MTQKQAVIGALHGSTAKVPIHYTEILNIAKKSVHFGGHTPENTMLRILGELEQEGYVATTGKKSGYYYLRWRDDLQQQFPGL